MGKLGFYPLIDVLANSKCIHAAWMTAPQREVLRERRKAVLIAMRDGDIKQVRNAEWALGVFFDSAGYPNGTAASDIVHLVQATISARDPEQYAQRPVAQAHLLSAAL